MDWGMRERGEEEGERRNIKYDNIVILFMFSPLTDFYLKDVALIDTQATLYIKKKTVFKGRL